LFFTRYPSSTFTKLVDYIFLPQNFHLDYLSTTTTLQLLQSY